MHKYITFIYNKYWPDLQRYIDVYFLLKFPTLADSYKMTDILE